MNYRERLYSTYVSSHTLHLYGEATLDGIRKQFPVWKKYYGRFFPPNQDATILDIGCGDGGFVYYLKSLGYKKSSGIDISPEQVEVAKKLGIKDIECADIMSFLKDKNDSYDVIFARDVIEHFAKDDVLELLQLLFNSVKRKGKLIIQTLNGESPFGSRYRYGDFTHEIAFTSGSLNQLLRAVGFSEIAFYPSGPVPHGLKSAIRFLLWKGIELILEFYVLIETGSGKGRIYTQNIIAVGKK